MKKKIPENTARLVLKGIIVAEVALLFLFGLFLVTPFIKEAYAIVGANNVTVITYLQVGNVYPEVLSVIFTNGATITLIPNSTSNAIVYTIVRDFNGEADIMNVTAVMFKESTSSYGASDDNNRHYTNLSCSLNLSYGTIYEANASCIIPLQYYAEAGLWNLTVTVMDNATLTGQNYTNITVNSLLALGLPDSINYGLVNASTLSSEEIANVTNFGNVMMNLSLQGYAVAQGDNLAMNCSLGSNKNISIGYEKYNLTMSNAGSMNLTQAQLNYSNLTSANVVRTLGLPYRQNDVAPYTDDTNSTYWRIYVPLGVAGSCQGNIIFGAVQSAGT